MKLAKGLFHNFHMTTRIRSSIYDAVMRPNSVDDMSTSVDSSETASLDPNDLVSLIWVRPVCSDVSYPIFKFFDVLYFFTLLYFSLSSDVAVIQWITSCHKNRMTTRV